MRRLFAVALAALVACGPPDRKPVQGGIRDVVVVLKGSEEPLPFDPRAGRMARVTSELAGLLGHSVTFELDAALSPDLRASLEESLLRSFENLVTELVGLRRDDPEAFAAARRLERVVCRYEAAAKATTGAIEPNGKVLVVRAPPEEFPLLARGITSEALWTASVDALDAKWGDVDPAQLPARDREAWFAYMMRTRPGYGYLWTYKRKGDFSARRLDHAGKILRLAEVTEPRSELDHRVKHWLLEGARFIGEGGAHPTTAAYERWLARSASSFDADERLLLAKALFDRQGQAIFPSFDRLGFALAVHDARPPSPELVNLVLCPAKKMGRAEIRYGCSVFFAQQMKDDASLGALADAIRRRQDPSLFELALLNPDVNGGARLVDLVDRFTRDDAFFTRGVRLLFEEYERRDDVRGALERAASRWWRDQPARRGLLLLVIARQGESRDDEYWSRFPSEYGGAIGPDVLASFLAEGPRAAELAPRIWPALAKSAERDARVVDAMGSLLQAGADRSRGPILALEARFCAERDAAGMARLRDLVARHGGAPVAPRDLDLARCAK